MKRNVVAFTLLIEILVVSALTKQTALCQPSGTTPLPNEELIERILEELGEEELDETIIERLTHYRSAPLLLNIATVQELASIPGISPQDARRILDFVHNKSPISFDQFTEVEELDQQTIDILRRYTQLKEEITVEEPGELHIQFRLRGTTDIQERKGYRDTLFRRQIRTDPLSGDSLGIDTISIGRRYSGSGVGMLTRLLISYKEFSGGLTFEKDPGERLLYHDTLNFSYGNYELVQPLSNLPITTRTGLGSFLGFHAEARLKPAHIIVGDYRAEFGQGLLFGNQFAGRKGGTPTRDSYRGSSGIKAYRSSGETGYLKGVGITFMPGQWLPSWLEAGAIVSRRYLDATVDQNSSGKGVVTSVRENGLLQTPSDIRRDDQLTEYLVGADLKGRFDNGLLELTGYVERYSLPIQTGDEDHTRQSHYASSLSGEIMLPAGKIFGEMAVASGKSFAGILGTALDLPGADVTLSGRLYSPDFYSPHGTGFGERPSNPGNEMGLYIGLRSRLFRRTFLSIYGDLYHFPEGTGSFPFPLYGIDGMALLEYGVTSELKLSLRLRAEERDETATAQDEFGRKKTALIGQTISSARFDAAWNPNKGSVETRFRLEGKWSGYSDLLPSAKGSLSWMDLRWQVSPQLLFGTRLILFHAESSDVRLYEFEQDLPGRVSVPSLSGEGGRFYGLLRWKPFTSFGLSIKYSETWYADRTKIAQGTLREIEGNTIGQLALQIDWEK